MKLGPGQHPTRPTLCGNLEGWGPWNSARWDFTPCFFDAALIAWALVGVVLGMVALRTKDNNGRSCRWGRKWTRMATLIVNVALVGTSCLEAALLLTVSSRQDELRLWATAALSISFVTMAIVAYRDLYESFIPGNIVSLFWLMTWVLYAIRLRSVLSQDADEAGAVGFRLFCVAFGLLSAEVVILWVLAIFQDHKEARSAECPISTMGLGSKLSYEWVTPLMKWGYGNRIDESHLWNLRTKDMTSKTGNDLEVEWNKERSTAEPSLWRALFREFGIEYIYSGIFKAVNDVLSYVQPQLLRLLLAFVSSCYSSHAQPKSKGVLLAVCMFVTGMVQSICMNQYLGRINETGMRVRGGLTSLMHQKTMKLSDSGLSAHPRGSIINHVAVDTQRLQILAQFGHQIWSAPLQLILCLLSLYKLLGFSMVAGIVVMILTIPLNSVLIKMMMRLQITQMQNKDMRMNLMTEIISHMKSIKLLGWQTAFLSRVSELRNRKELKTLRDFGITQAFANIIWSSSPFLVSCSSFVVFVLTQETPLDAQIIFPALYLFNLLSFPLAVVPMTISTTTEATVAINRIKAYLTADESQPYAVKWHSPPEDDGAAILVEDGVFSWNKDPTQPSLQIDHYVVLAQSLCCIVGPVGSGKSTFLQAIVGEVWKERGATHIWGSIAYVSQTPWIMAASVKENILFGLDWDPGVYDSVIKACALEDDLATFSDGDESQVGGQGQTLSGGQKARLTLARALYARADIYLLDDCLSAVDQHVGRHIIANVLGPNGILRDRTRVLATHNTGVLQHADSIIYLEGGKVMEQGRARDILSSGGVLAAYIRNHSATDNRDSMEKQGKVKPLEERPTEPTSEDDAASSSIIHTNISIQAEEGSKPAVLSGRNPPLRAPLRRVPVLDRSARLDEAVVMHTQKQGSAQWGTYSRYATACGYVNIFFYFMTMVVAQVVSAGTNIWMKIWAESNERSGANARIGLFIGVYFAFGLGSVALTAVQDLLLWAARRLHEQMAYAVFNSPMSFFETTASGSILNRFSSDIYCVDEMLGPLLDMFLITVIRTLVALIIIESGVPLLILALVPLGILYSQIQRYFVRTSRELKSLESETKSHAFTLFQDSLAGLATIRAFRHQTRFKYELCESVDRNLRAYFASLCANRWLSLRLEFIGATTVFLVALSAVIEATARRRISAALIGLIMSYALQITQVLNSLVQAGANIQTNVVSVERVAQYIDLPPEAGNEKSGLCPRASWPERGEIAFSHYSTRYREGSRDVLRDVTLKIKAGEKIGVVGRTGAGKSSLALALFRIIEPTHGTIEIDDLDISTLTLQALRGRLAIIPQDSAVFSGTIRSNLDPESTRDDTELWSALARAHLKPHVEKMDGQLDATVGENGSKMSVGQQQMISLARVMLRGCRVLVLDEATAAVDPQTDALIQESIRGNIFAHSTVITIAHRIDTVLDYDRILLLDHGEVAEFDGPWRLFQARGLFYALVQEAGLESMVETGDRT